MYTYMYKYIYIYDPSTPPGFFDTETEYFDPSRVFSTPERDSCHTTVICIYIYTYIYTYIYMTHFFHL